MSEFESGFSGWLARICQIEKPAASVVAYNIGLFETEAGYSAYLVGADSYSEDDDWACQEAFTPAERYLQLPGVWSDWERVQEAVVASTQAFLDAPAGRDSFLVSAQAVTVGFDDGDLIRVK